MVLACIAAKLVTALRGMNGQANVRCDLSRKLLQAWLASNGRVEGEEGVLDLLNVCKLGFTALI